MRYPRIIQSQSVPNESPHNLNADQLEQTEYGFSPKPWTPIPTLSRLVLNRPNYISYDQCQRDRHVRSIPKNGVSSAPMTAKPHPRESSALLLLSLPLKISLPSNPALQKRLIHALFSISQGKRGEIWNSLIQFSRYHSEYRGVIF